MLATDVSSVGAKFCVEKDEGWSTKESSVWPPAVWTSQGQKTDGDLHQTYI